MVYDPDFLDELQDAPSSEWTGIVYRHMFALYPPDRENNTGARWNPRGIAAIYTSLEKATVLAEAEYQLSLQPLRPRARRTIYRISVHLSKTLNLSKNRLDSLGISEDVLREIDMEPCQRLGYAVEWLEYDGLFVPSVRHGGANLVIYPANQDHRYRFDILDSEVIEEGIR
jgi:RES domain-containing protein